MTDEILFDHGTTMVRKLRLAPGESMPWHRDPFQRVAVVSTVRSRGQTLALFGCSQDFLRIIRLIIVKLHDSKIQSRSR